MRVQAKGSLTTRPGKRWIKDAGGQFLQTPTMVKVQKKEEYEWFVSNVICIAFKLEQIDDFYRYIEEYI